MMYHVKNGFMVRFERKSNPINGVFVESMTYALMDDNVSQCMKLMIPLKKTYLK